MFIQTNSGRKFYYTLDIETLVEQIYLPDICHSLTAQSRFLGHTNQRISIAQHSLAVAEIVPEKFRKEALLHDALEAYIGDIPSPLKPFLGFEFRQLETSIDTAIRLKFNLPLRMSKEVARADSAILFAEKELGFSQDIDWGYQPKLRLKPVYIPHLFQYYGTAWTADAFQQEILLCE